MNDPIGRPPDKPGYTTQPDPQKIAYTLMNGIKMCVRVLKEHRAVVEAKFLTDLADCLQQLQLKHVVPAEAAAHASEGAAKHLAREEHLGAMNMTRRIATDELLFSSIWGCPKEMHGDYVNVRTMFVLNLRKFSYDQYVDLINTGKPC